MTDDAAETGTSTAVAPELVRITSAIVTWGPFAMASAVIFWFSSQPSFGRPDFVQALLSSIFGNFTWYAYFQGAVATLNAASSWIAHLTEYAALALTGVWAVTRQWPDLSWPYLAAFGYAALFALSDEFHQSFVPGRHSDWRDVLTDWAGAAIAVGAAMAYRSRQRDDIQHPPKSEAVSTQRDELR